MTTQVIDDRDPAIVYSTGWTRGRLGSSIEYNMTTTYTDSAGPNATLVFQGVSVAVYGTIGSSNSNRSAPRTSYTVDGNLSTYEPALMPSIQYRQHFFQSPRLPNDTHTLVVTSLSNNSRFYLDYFIVTTGASPSTSSTASSLGNTMSNYHIRTATLAGSITALV